MLLVVIKKVRLGLTFADETPPKEMPFSRSISFLCRTSTIRPRRFRMSAPKIGVRTFARMKIQR